jgi:hypothetical protein
MKRRRQVGRCKVDFEVLQRIAADELSRTPLATADECWTLSRKSSLYRRKDGTYTLCLLWKGVRGMTLMSTMRGIVLEQSR